MYICIYIRYTPPTFDHTILPEHDLFGIWWRLVRD